jgi:hypothetical protein
VTARAINGKTRATTRTSGKYPLRRSADTCGLSAPVYTISRLSALGLKERASMWCYPNHVKVKNNGESLPLMILKLLGHRDWIVTVSPRVVLVAESVPAGNSITSFDPRTILLERHSGMAWII